MTERTAEDAALMAAFRAARDEVPATEARVLHAPRPKTPVGGNATTGKKPSTMGVGDQSEREAATAPPTGPRVIQPGSGDELVTTRSGLVHLAHCRRLRPVHQRWPWVPALDGPGVARACKSCLPNGLPS